MKFAFPASNALLLGCICTVMGELRSGETEDRRAMKTNEPFPDEFDMATCNYLDCVGDLLNGFDQELGDVKLNRYSRKAKSKAMIAQKSMLDEGNVIVSVNRLLQGMKWIEVLGRRADNLDNDEGIGFAGAIGDAGSTCASNLLDDMINGLVGEGLVRDNFLRRGKPNTKLESARMYNEDGKWKKSIWRANMGIRAILDATGERDLPVCRRRAPDERPNEFKQGNTTPATNGQTTNMLSQFGVDEPSNVVCGAVQTVLPHKTNPDICFAGAVNGGIWRTFSCRDAEPVWEPLTDELESLSISDMVFDEEDPSGNTIVASIGGTSSFFRAGGRFVGFLRTTNAMAANPTWDVLDNANGVVNFRNNNVQFRSIFVRGSLMIAAAFRADPFSCANIGIFRSTDGGDTWTNVLFGVALAVAADQNDPSRFYATLDFTSLCAGASRNGVFTSDDFGQTWTETSIVPDGSIFEGQLNNAKLSVAGSRVWSALLRNGQADSISYSDDQGRNWIRMDDVLTSESNGGTIGLNPREKPGGQGRIHFSLLASPSNKNEVYVGGDRQDFCDFSCFPNSIGASNFVGRLFRGDATVEPTGLPDSPQWEHLTHRDDVAAIPGGGTASRSAPHADSRDMEIRADGNILEGDDGGIAVRTDPGTNEGDWYGVCGNMQVFETHSVAYEPVLGNVLFGNQDTGTIAGVLGEAGTFTSIITADGGDCMIDYTSDPDVMYWYIGFQFYLRFRRVSVDKRTGAILGSRNFGDVGASFVPIAALNPFDQTVFVIAKSDTFGNDLILWLNRGDDRFEFNSRLAGTVSAMEWAADGKSLYVATSSNVARCRFRSSSLTCRRVGVVPAIGFVRHLAVDPQDANVVFAAATRGGAGLRFQFPEVFMSVDGGVTWSDVTVPGSLLDTAALGGSVEFIGKGSVNVIAVATSNGVLIPDGDVGTGWKLLSDGLPTVAVLDMVYEAVDDTLVVATLGRGVWFLEKASEAVSAGGGVVVNSESRRLRGQWQPLRTGTVSRRESEGVQVDFDSLVKIMADMEEIIPFPVPSDDAPIEAKGTEKPILDG